MKSLFLFSVIVIFVLSFSTSCKKDKPPKAVITVVNSLGVAQSGAIVRIYSDPSYYNDIIVNGTDTQHIYDPVGYYDPDNSVLYDIKTTDSEGKTEHEFKYESIYNVEVKLPKKINNHLWDTLRGEGAVILKLNEVYQETIIVR